MKEICQHVEYSLRYVGNIHAFTLFLELRYSNIELADMDMFQAVRQVFLNLSFVMIRLISFFKVWMVTFCPLSQKDAPITTPNMWVNKRMMLFPRGLRWKQSTQGCQPFLQETTLGLAALSTRRYQGLEALSTKR